MVNCEVISFFLGSQTEPLGFRLDPTWQNHLALIVSQVREKSRSYRCGLREGDQIVGIAGYDGPLTYDSVMDYLDSFQGDLTLYIYRGRSELADEEAPPLSLDSKPCCIHGTAQAQLKQQQHQQKVSPVKSESSSHASPQPSSMENGEIPGKSFQPTIIFKPPPPPPSPPTASSSSDSSPSWQKKATERYSKYEKMETSPLQKDKVIPGKPPVELVQEVKDFLQDLKHSREPQYPSFGGAGNEPVQYSSQAQMVFNQQKSKAGETKVQIEVSGTEGHRGTIVTERTFKSDYQKSRPTGSDSGDAVLMMPERPQVKEATEISRSFLTHESTTESKPRFNDPFPEGYESGPGVETIKRQWPPPSNASGVDIVKDMWMPGMPYPPPQTESQQQDTGRQWEASQDAMFEPVSMEGSYISGMSDSSRPSHLDLAPHEVHAPAHTGRSHQHATEVAEQVRKCQSIARALKAPPRGENESSRGQRIFARRKDRVAKWIAKRRSESLSPGPELSSPSSENESYHTAVESESEMGIPKAVRNPQGDITDYQKAYREFGEVFTNMMGPEKSHQLSASLLEGEGTRGRGAQMFSKRREVADKWVVNEVPDQSATPTPIVQRDVNDSRWNSERYITPDEVVSSVHKAAANKADFYTMPPANIHQQTYTETTSTPQPQTYKPHEPLRVTLTPMYGDESRTESYRVSQGPVTPAEEYGVESFAVPHGPSFGQVGYIQPQPQRGRVDQDRLFSPPRGYAPAPVNQLFSPVPFAPLREQGLPSPGRSSRAPARERAGAFSPVAMSVPTVSPPGSRPYSPATLPRATGFTKVSQFGVRDYSVPRGWTPTPQTTVTRRAASVDRKADVDGPHRATQAKLAITTPTTRIITSMTQTKATSTFSLPKTWKSFSNAYRETHD